MSVRNDPIDEAARRARVQVAAVLRDGRAARLNAGLSQRAVATALGCSRQLVAVIERGGLEDIGTLQLVRYCAALGLDIPIRAYAGGAILRDAGQLRLLARFRGLISPRWRVRTEVPVSADPRDRRAADMVLAREGGVQRIGVEAVTRLADAQAQVRPRFARAAPGRHRAAPAPVSGGGILLRLHRSRRRRSPRAGSARCRR